jgi:mannose-P-dolichol utilization defect protein 1
VLIISTVISIIGPLIILLPQIRRIITKRSVEGLDIRGLQLGTTCTAGWLIYGITENLELIWVANLIGLALLIWITRLVLIFGSEIILKKHIRIPILFSALLLLVSTKSTEPIGLICMIVSFATPLPQVIRVFKDLNLKGLSKLTYVNAIVVHLSWIQYGLSNNDPNVLFPNLYGMSIAFILLFRVIKSRRLIKN